jgi:hypothetical protein
MRELMATVYGLSSRGERRRMEPTDATGLERVVLVTVRPPSGRVVQTLA